MRPYHHPRFTSALYFFIMIRKKKIILKEIALNPQQETPPGIYHYDISTYFSNLILL